MWLQHNVPNIPLKRRELPAEIVLDGHPQVHGRILWVGEDRRTACVAWKMTPGATKMTPDPQTQDLLYILDGEVEVRPDGGEPLSLRPGTWVEMPRSPYEMRVSRTLHKISVLYHPTGLKLEAEPL